MGRSNKERVPQNGKSFYLVAAVDMADGTMSSIQECVEVQVDTSAEAHMHMMRQPGCYDEEEALPETYVVFEVKAVRKYKLLGGEIKAVKEIKSK